MKVAWNRTDLEHTAHPKYLGVTLDRTLSYKQHKDEGGHTQQPPEEVSKLQMGDKRKYNQDNSFS